MGRFRVVVAAPPQQVFDYLAEPRHRPEWQASLRGVEILADPDRPTGVGTRWLDHTMVGASPTLKIVEMRPPGEAGKLDAAGKAGVWAEAGEWHGLRADLTLRFEPLPDARGTLVTGEATIGGTMPWLPVRLVLRVLAPPAIRSDLRRAARLLESRAR